MLWKHQEKWQIQENTVLLYIRGDRCIALIEKYTDTHHDEVYNQTDHGPKVEKENIYLK